MSFDPSEQGETAPASRANTISEAPQGGTSPLRFVLVLVPLLIILGAGSNLLGFWSTPSQQAAREERLREAARDEERRKEAAREAERRAAEPVPAPVPPPDFGVAPGKPDSIEPAFDAEAVIRGLASANVEDGARIFRMCAACHAATRNAASTIGPGLWGVVGRAKATYPGYAYSKALSDKGGAWSYRELAEYLHDPRAFVPGNRMAFRGIADNARIASVIAYLRTLSEHPPPLPK